MLVKYMHYFYEPVMIQKIDLIKSENFQHV